jgi:hypothetical protein
MVPGLPIRRSCSAITKRYSSLHTTIGAATSAPMPSVRRTVACSKESSPISGSSCLGYFSRDSGHRRVPEPPESTTGCTRTPEAASDCAVCISRSLL